MASKQKSAKPATQFAAASAAENPEAAATSAAPESSLALSLVNQDAGKMDLARFTRRNIPPMIKPDDVPVGGCVTGRIVAIVKSPVTTIKGCLLHLRHSNGTEFTFPVTGSIRSALCPGIKIKKGQEDAGAAEVFKALQVEVGNDFLARRFPDKISKEFGRNFFVFDVMTAKA